MKLIFWDFTIEQDSRCFIVSEYWDKKSTKDWTITYWLKDQVFPSTIERALLICLHRLQWKNIWDTNIEDYIDQIKKIQEDFLIKLKEQINNIK